MIQMGIKSVNFKEKVLFMDDFMKQINITDLWGKVELV